MRGSIPYLATLGAEAPDKKISVDTEGYYWGNASIEDKPGFKSPLVQRASAVE